MSTYVLMRILESAPRRYDLCLQLLTLGQVSRAYDRLTSHLAAGHQVLDVGCGTGALTLRAARNGALIKGIDVNAQMLEMAAESLRRAGLECRAELVEMGVAELDSEAAESYDAVISGLCFSELSDDELSFTLAQVTRMLRPGGLLLVADEARPRSLPARWAHALLRAPLAILTWVLTQQTTRPVAHLPERLAASGLTVESVRATGLGTFVEIVARKPGEAP